MAARRRVQGAGAEPTSGPDHGLLRRLAALSDPLRLRALRLLAREELAVGELARVLQVPQSTASRHLKALSAAGWIERRTEGPATFLRLADPLPDDAAALWSVVDEQVGDAWAEDLARLERVLAERTADSRAFFHGHAEQWAQLRETLHGRRYLPAVLLAALPRRPDIVDLGCGTGDLVAQLAPLARRVVGVDREAAMLQAARRRIQGMAGVELIQADLEELPLPDRTFDLALCMLVLHLVPSPGKPLAEAARVLRPGGRLVVLDMVPHRRRVYRRAYGHVHLGFAPSDLEPAARAAGLRLDLWQPLPPDPDARGPGLFVAAFDRPR